MAIDWRDSKHPARLEYEASVKAEFGEQPKRINSPRAAWTASLVAGEVWRMRVLLKFGLHPVYDKFSDFLCDYFPDFSWNPEQFKRDVAAVLADPQWQQLAAEIKAQRGWDFVHELNEALKIDPDNC